MASSRATTVSARIFAIAAALGALPMMACDSSVNPSESLHAEVTDATADVSRGPFAPAPPDLIRGTADVVAGNLTFTVRFAPGTFDRQMTWLFIEMDTDQNTQTGAPTFGLGADYLLSWSTGGDLAAVLRCPTRSAACPNAVAMPALTFFADGVDVVLPLAALGNDDGRLNFRIYSHAIASSPDTDYMPDIGLSPGRTR